MARTTLRLAGLLVLLAPLGVYAASFKFPTGQSLVFGSDSASFRLYPNSSTNAYVAVSFGKISELDVLGNPILSHTLLSLDGITPTISTGTRTAGTSQYTYLTMDYSAAKLGSALSTRANCPTLESILSASVLGVDTTVLESGTLGAVAPAPETPSVPSGLLPIGAALTAATSTTPVGTPTLSGGPSGKNGPAPELKGIEVLPNTLPAASDTALAADELPVVTDDIPAAAGSLAASILEATDGGEAPAEDVVMPVEDALTEEDASSPGRRLKQMKTTSLTAAKSSGGIPAATAAAAAALSALPPMARASGASSNTNLAAASFAGTLAAGNLTGTAMGKTGPSIRVSFMFGFSANKTFPYGKYGSVTVPTNGVKFTVEAKNWPFCSLFNSLKMELEVNSTAKSTQAQFVMDTGAGSGSTAMESSAFPIPVKRRQLMDAMEGELLDSPTPVLSSAAAAAMALAARYAQRKKTAKLLISPTEAAAIEMPTYAFPSTNYSNEANVTITLFTEGVTKLGLTFPYFDALMYDPVVYFTDTSSMGIIEGDGSGVTPIKAGTGTSASTAAARRRSTSSAGLQQGAGMLLNLALLLLATLLFV